MIPSINPSLNVGVALSFTGNGAQNRAYPHGLGRTPVGMFGIAVTGVRFIYQTKSDSVGQIEGGVNSFAAVTAWDNVNIYVGVAAGAISNDNAVAFSLVVF